MSSGQTLDSIFWNRNEPPASNYATIDTRNNDYVLDFDPTTQEGAVFKSLLPRNYSGGGITVYVHAAMSTANAGTCGWLVAFERIGTVQNIGSDSFAADQTITAATVPGTNGDPFILNVAVSNGANMDNIAVGEIFRIRLRRDVANDNAAGDAEFIGMELKET